MDGKQAAVYFLTNRKRATLYIGMTTSLVRRIYEHRIGAVAGFTRQYGLKKLVYYELYEQIEAAALRERQLKAWKRQWKIDLIESMNPDWHDLYETII